MKFNFNALEHRASDLIREGNIRDALRIYFFMADGDPSLDAGYLGMKIGQCYEALGEIFAAKYWYGRAMEEGPGAWREAIEAHRKLEEIVTINDLIPITDYVIEG